MDDRELLGVADALGIPWRRLLESEIHAERELKRCLGDLNQDMPLWRILAALQMSVLDSWRIRERISALSWEARAGRTSPTVFTGSRWSIASTRTVMFRSGWRTPDRPPAEAEHGAWGALGSHLSVDLIIAGTVSCPSMS